MSKLTSHNLLISSFYEFIYDFITINFRKNLLALADAKVTYVSFITYWYLILQ